MKKYIVSVHYKDGTTIRDAHHVEVFSQQREPNALAKEVAKLPQFQGKEVRHVYNIKEVK